MTTLKVTRAVPQWLIWIAWIAAAAVCPIGLRNYRVSNSMDAWMPDLAAPAAYQSYLVIGFASDRIDSSVVAAKLRSLPVTSFCIDPAMVNLTARLTGITPGDFVVGNDASYYGVFCFARQNTPDRDFMDQVEQALRDVAPRNAFAVGGPTAFRVAMDKWSQDRLALIMVAILVAGGVMLRLVTGSFRIAATSMLAICFSQIIFLGSISWLGIPVDMAVALVPPMMMGMGFSYAAHRALRRRSIGILAICGLAAAAGIASFATADLMPVRHFALSGVPGLCLVWLATVTLVQPDRAARRRRTVWMRRLRRISIYSAKRLPRLTIASALMITLAGIAVAPRLQIQSNPLNFFPKNSQIAEDFELLNRRLTGMLPSQVVLDGDADPREILSKTPGMRKVINISAWLGGGHRTYLCLANDDAVDSLAAGVPAWQSWAQSHHAALEWHGVAAQIHRSGASMRWIAVESLPSMMILIAVVVFLVFRRISLAVLGAWICLLPVCGLLLIAVFASWKLGPVTLVIGSITAGLTVDDTLHLMTASRRRGSIINGLIECWKPCVGSSLAAALCFGLFALSAFEPTSQFGTMMALATVLAMLANQSVLAACLSRVSILPPRALIVSETPPDS